MPYRAWILFVLVAVVAAGCAGDDTATSAGGEPTEPAVAAETPDSGTDAPETDDGTTAGTTVAVTSTDLGEVLTDGDDNTLYLFLNDDQQASTCYDDCEENWPPLAGPAEAGNGVEASLLGVVERDDGTSQVTYNDWPLYYFAGDAAPGDTSGQGVGDVWFAVDAAGEPVREVASDDAEVSY